MKIKRFVADNMRQALINVRKEQGPNAVILSNRRVDGGIEVVAAVDYDETLIKQSFGRKQNESTESSLPPVTSQHIDDEPVDSDIAENSLDGELTAEDIETVTMESSLEADTLSEAADTEPVATVQGPAINAMRDEIHSLRFLLEDQLASLAWNDEARRDPTSVCILRHFAAIGLDTDVARQVAALATARTNAGSYLDHASQSLAQALPILDDSLLEKGGVVAVLGPTGVGKTTSIAKLAARFALRHGRDQVALISTDSFRIGAQEQLATFAQILDVPVHLVTDEDDFSLVLNSVADKKLVLIDTAGVSQRAQGLAQHLSTIKSRSVKIQMYLALAANGQSEALDEVIREFGRVKLDGCILTKVDEAASLGPAFSSVIRHQLPIAFLANGQRVPEDLHSAAHKKTSMVNYSMRLMRESRIRIDEEFMARNFGEVRTHAYA